MRERVFDGRMLGLNGQIVTYPQWFFALPVNTQLRLIRVAKEQRRETVRIVDPDRGPALGKLPLEVLHLL